LQQKYCLKILNHKNALNNQLILYIHIPTLSMKTRLFVAFISAVFLTACGSQKKVSSSNTNNLPQYKYIEYKIDSSYFKDTSMLAFLQPYSKGVRSIMDVVIGTLTTTLETKTPEGTLGNFAADAMRNVAQKVFSRKVDIAIVNYSGLRVDIIPAGPITLGKMYELMPFDNLLVLQQLKGTELQQLLDLIASKNGWPIAGVKMQIKDGKAVNVTVNNKPLDATAIYTIATTDYTANGGEGISILKSVKQISNGYLFRDALIDYVKDKTSKGQTISESIENRTVYAK
jgi:2',3'-cyclic-nucleotide 2'-phosphodiesterase (5'-nucleotidase family)